MDKDLESIQQARDILSKAKRAQEELSNFTQKQVDDICTAIADAAFKQAAYLGQLAVDETGIGRADSKKIKNEFCTRNLMDAMKDLKTAGIISRDEQRMVFEIAEPMGTVAAIIPTTNPTSTAICKILISIKSRNTIVISPHPRAVKCISESARICLEAGLKAGLPQGAIGWMTTVTLDGTNELMKHRDTSVILSTGGEGIVTAAYSSGKPAFGVGPGNCPVYIEKSADIKHAVSNIVESKLFDYGTVCATEQTAVIDASIDEEVRAEFRRQKAYFVNPDEKKLLEKVCLKGPLMNPAVVGIAAVKIAKMAGFEIPEDTTVLLVPLGSIGPEEPISREVLAPVLGYMVAPDWKRACESCLEVLRFGGMGHTLIIHSRNQEVIMEFAMKKPAYRLCVNTPATFGAIGYSTGLFPSMSLGCGTSGGNVSADNIGPHNLINVKRLAFDIRDDAFSPTMKVSEAVVSDFVPFQEVPSSSSGSAKSSTPSAPREPAKTIVYNGRRKDLGSL